MKRSLAEVAAKVLARDAESTSKPSPEARARAVSAIAETMRDRKRKQRIFRRVLGFGAVAASIAAAIALGRAGHSRDGVAQQPTSAQVEAAAPRRIAPAAASFVRGSPALMRKDVRHDVLEGAPLEAGDCLVVDRGSRMTVALPGGSYLVLDEPTQVELLSAAPKTIFALESGAVHADVAKLSGGERFIIRTADAEIEVHGTSFEVSRVASDPACGNGTTTRVKVREGVVAVRSGANESFVRANESWPKDCASAPPAASSTPTTLGVAAPRPAAAPAPAVIAAPTSDLSAQNDQFERAGALKRANDATGAIAAYEEFLARYPSSHLAQSARAERMRLLRDVNKDRARLAARDYLDRYPSGFARSDAELILAGQ